MKKKFLPKTPLLPQLNYDLILFESTTPLLFTCTDDSDNLYVSTCYCSTGKQREWVVSHTTPSKILDLLLNKITIRQLFDSEDSLFVVSITQGEASYKTKRVPLEDIDSHILPTAGYRLDAEPGEYDSEINELKERKERQCHTVITSIENSFEIYSGAFPCTIPITFRSKLKIPRGCYTKQKKSLSLKMECCLCR